MTLKSLIKDGKGEGHLAGVSNAGEVTVSGFGDGNALTNSVFKALNVANTAFSFFPPQSGQNFYITTMIFNWPGAGALLEIYETSSPTSTTVDKQIIKADLPSGKGFAAIPFSIGGFPVITEGEFLNAKTDTTTVNLTIVGFYKPLVHRPSIVSII